MTILFSPMALAQGFLLGAEEPATEEAKPAPKPAVTADQPAEKQAVAKVEPAPVVDKLADVRCSANKFTSLGSGSGPNKNDAEDIVIAILGITKPLDRLIVQTAGIKPGEPPGEFGISNRRGYLEIGLPGKGFMGGTVWLPAKMCVTDKDVIMAYIDGSSVGMSNAIPVGIENLGNGAVKVTGSSDGKAPLAGTFKITSEALR
jgi:hypothetical protein